MPHKEINFKYMEGKTESFLKKAQEKKYPLDHAVDRICTFKYGIITLFIS